MNKKNLTIAAVVGALIIGVSCSSGSQKTAVKGASDIASPSSIQTQTIIETPTPLPTEIPTPTSTPTPIVIYVAPTDTPAPSVIQTNAEIGAPTAQCVDGSVSYSLHHQGTCSHHGGVSQWL